MKAYLIVFHWTANHRVAYDNTVEITGPAQHDDCCSVHRWHPRGGEVRFNFGVIRSRAERVVHRQSWWRSNREPLVI